MKKKKSLTRLYNKTKRAGITIAVGLIFSFFAWATQTINYVKLPDPGIPTELYASEVKDDLRAMFKSAIDSAQESIHLLVYTLTDETIIHALKEKAQNGVDVRVIVDAKASPYAAQRLGPQVNTTRRLGTGLMHSKILVVDRSTVWIGSANMTADSLLMHSNLVLGMHTPDFAEYLIAKVESIPEIDRGKSFASREFSIGGQTVECFLLPDEATNGMRKIKNLIRTAEKTVRVAMFTWTRQDFAHELIKASKRGVHVQAVIDKNSAKGASAQVVKLLQQNNVDVRLSKGVGLLHHKFMVVDSQTLVNGSANWTKAAFGSNDDCYVVINGLSGEQREKLEEEWALLYADSQPAQEVL